MHRLKLWALILVGLAAASFWGGLLYGMFPPTGGCQSAEDVFACEQQAYATAGRVVVASWLVMFLSGAIGGVLFYFYTRHIPDRLSQPDRQASDGDLDQAAAHGEAAQANGAAPHEVRCEQVGGVNCPFTARGSDPQGVRSELMAHIAASHQPALDGASPEDVAKLEGRIERLVAQAPPGQA